MIFEGGGIGDWRGLGYDKGGLGGLTSPFTVLSYLGSPSMMATSGNGRETALGVGAILLDLHIFGRDIKTQKSRGVPQVAKSVYSTKLKHTHTHKKKHSIYNPSTDGLSLSGMCGKPWSPSYIFCYGPSSNAYQ